MPLLQECLRNKSFRGLGMDEVSRDIERIINALTTAGDGLISGSMVFVNSLADLPTPTAGVIPLLPNVTYFFISHVDLLGNRLVGGANTVILGASSENCSITSTGLGTSTPLLSSVYTTPIRHITFKDVGTVLDIDGTGQPNPIALDWTGVNFLNVPTVGSISNIDNWIFSKGAFLNSKGLSFSGSAGTISIDNSLLVGDGEVGSLISIPETVTITRRLRIVYSSFVVTGDTVGIDVSVSATIPDESYILDTVNFSGGGQYLEGVGDTSNTSLFVNCTGITNTAVNGQLYMVDNATPTPIPVIDTYYKIVGTSIPSPDNHKYLVADDRLTCDARIARTYLIQATLSFTSGSNNVCEFGFYDSKIPGIRTPSTIKATANSAGRAESVSLSCVVNHVQGDYLEVHVKNLTGAINVTVTDLNFIVTQIV